MAQKAPKISQCGSEMTKHTSKSTDNHNNCNQFNKATTLTKIEQDTKVEDIDSKESNEKPNVDKNENKNNESVNVKRQESKSTDKENDSNQREKTTVTLNKVSQSTNVENVNSNTSTKNKKTEKTENTVKSDQVLNSIIVQHSTFKSEYNNVIDLNPLLKALSSSNQAHNVLKKEFRKRHVIYDKQTDIFHFKCSKFENNYKFKMSLKLSNKQSIESS